MRILEESIFWEIFYGQQSLRSELAERLLVSPATISRAVDILLEKRLVVEISATISSRGRKPGVLQVNPELAHLLGLEIDRNHICAVVTDFCGNLLGRSSVTCDPRKSLRTALKLCGSVVRAALADSGLEIGEINRLGVGHTGALDVENCLCLSWGDSVEWRNVDLRNTFMGIFGIDVTIDDRARAVALAEHWASPCGPGLHNIIYVHIGTGIGAGIFIDGRLLRGSTQAGGEIGHIVIDRSGPPCACGHRGCVESFASTEAVIRRVRAAVEAGARTMATDLSTHNDCRITIEHIIAAARQSDPVCTDALRAAGEALGIGIANAVQLLNPSLVVLTGRFANLAREYLLDAICQTIREQCFETVSRGLEIRLARYRKDLSTVGCALLAAHQQAALLIQQRLFQNGHH